MMDLKPKKRLLILGGTGDAIALAQQAAQLSDRFDIISSLAGRTQQPLLPPGAVRQGGFGGVAGLVTYLQTQQIDCLIDATHPFAAQISWNAAQATTRLGIPHLMLVRSAWQAEAGDRWFDVESSEAAAALLPSIANRIFLTIGRQELSAFAHLEPLWFVMRMIDPPHPPTPPGEVILARGPFSLGAERELMQRYHIQAIVSKNSGGTATYAKILAARELGLPVVMIQRPATPAVRQVETVNVALQWLEALPILTSGR
jgi:precorrin-6A/cobalt-precorrin-6A reductase